MRIIALPCLFFLTMLLTACGATQNLSVYSLNNDDLQQVISKELSKFDQRLSMLGVPMKFSVSNIGVEIGPDQRNVIKLDIAAEALVNALVMEYPIGMQLAVEGSPRFDSKEDAIYLEQVNLIDASIDTGGYKVGVNALNQETMAIINQFLKANPVYKLDTSNAKMALLSNIPLDLRITQGRLLLSPSL